MEQFYADCYERFVSLHNEIKKAIEGLSVEALDWIPAGNTNSINVLVSHLCGSERYWAAEIATGSPSDRVREQEFKAEGLNEIDLVNLLDATQRVINDAFEQLTLSDLEVMRYAEQNDMNITTAWAILHALEHSAGHVGHIQLTVQLWEE